MKLNKWYLLLKSYQRFRWQSNWKWKTEINELIDKAKKAMEENNIEEIKSSKDKLAEKAMALSSRVYEEAAKAQQAQTESNTEQTTSESKGKDDNIKEANFEEK